MIKITEFKAVSGDYRTWYVTITVYNKTYIRCFSIYPRGMNFNQMKKRFNYMVKNAIDYLTHEIEYDINRDNGWGI